MSLTKVFVIIVLWSHACATVSTSEPEIDAFSTRQQRALVFTPFTVLQFAIGLAVPAQVPNRTIFTNLGTLSNIPLPNNVKQLYPYARRSRQYTHDHFYEILEQIYAQNNYGRECIQKSICQLARIRFRGDDLIREILYLLFSFSRIRNPVAHTRYLIAEQNGNDRRVDCQQLYPACKLSIVDLISQD